MSKFIKISIFALVMGSFGFASPALAYYPSLSVSSNGGDTAVISINGAQPNSTISLSYTPSGSSLATTISNFGYTDYSGNYSTSVSANAYGFSNSSQIYVTVAGQQSNTVTYNYGYNGGCTYNCGSPYGLSLSQNSLYLNSGQNSTVTVYYSGSNYYYNNFYIASNSNSSVATASVSGNQINVYAQNNGTTNINVCATGGTSCASLAVTVSGSSGGCSYYNCSGSISLSQTNLTLNSGQSSNVNIYSNGYSGSYYISSNSNSSVASASISGSTLYVYAQSSGTTNIKVCQNSNGSSCAFLYVTVSGSGNCTYNCTGLQLSQTNVNLNLGQSTTVTAYNYNYGSLFISSNSNPSAVTASISGSSISIYGSNYGSGNLVICSNNSSQCATIYVSIGGSGSGSISLSQTSLSMNAGQSSTITVSGSGSYYIASNSNAAVVSANLNGSTLNLYALSSGTSTVNICLQNSSGQCASVYITVYGNNNGGNISLSQNNLNLNQGQSATVNIYNGYNYGSYYISSNSNSYVASASISGSQINVYASNQGSTNISICQSGFVNACATLYITVGNSGGGSGNIYFSSNNLPTMVLGQYYSYQIQAYGGTSPYNFAINSGSLPNGLTLSSSGLVFGTPTSANTVSFIVRATDLYGRSGTATFTINGNGGVLGANTYPNGTLISEYGTVYITYKNMKTPFANASAFLGLGYSFNNVVSVGNSGLVNSGYTVNSQYVQHPWGSWIKSGSTIYFVHQSGLIPVPSWDVFVNNGGTQNKIVNSNTWDFNLPMQSPMTYSDYRLQ